MSSTDYVALAKQAIAKGEASYGEAAEYITAAREQGWSWPAINRELGRGEKYAERIVAWATNKGGGLPFSREEGENERKDNEAARRSLKDPEQRKQVISALPTEQLDEIAQEATHALVERSRAQRAEHREEATVGELMGPDRFDPSESWADTLIIAANRKARELSKHIGRFGFVLGSMSPDEAFDYLNEAERLVAEARAAVQEQIHESAGV